MILEIQQMNDKVNYQIVDKDGKIVEDVSFDDYDKLADHMMEIADKYYAGVYSGGDSVNISTYDQSGELIYKDTASFEASEGDINLDESITELLEITENE
jgi:flagellar hook assembly protein FlgD